MDATQPCRAQEVGSSPPHKEPAEARSRQTQTSASRMGVLMWTGRLSPRFGKPPSVDPGAQASHFVPIPPCTCGCRLTTWRQSGCNVAGHEEKGGEQEEGAKEEE